MGSDIGGISLDHHISHSKQNGTMNYFLMLIGVLFIYMNFWFLISLLKKRNDVADIAWGPGFILLAWTSYFTSPDPGIRGVLVGILVTVWGSRLAWHIHKRNSGKSEDYRYLAWRKEWGTWFYIRSYIQIYILQGALLFLVATPIMLINTHAGSNLNGLDLLGLAVWLFGFFFEAIGDAQLSRFIKNPMNKGKLMQEGLWAYTRHPNYFGEITQWWGIWLIATSAPYGWTGIIGPITITFLIVKVSGIPLLEEKMGKNPEFLKYKQNVRMLIPFPKKYTH